MIICRWLLWQKGLATLCKFRNNEDANTPWIHSSNSLFHYIIPDRTFQYLQDSFIRHAMIDNARWKVPECCSRMIWWNKAFGPRIQGLRTSSSFLTLKIGTKPHKNYGSPSQKCGGCCRYKCDPTSSWVKVSEYPKSSRWPQTSGHIVFFTCPLMCHSGAPCARCWWPHLSPPTYLYLPSPCQKNFVEHLVHPEI